MTLFLLALLLLWIGGYLSFAAWVANMKPERHELAHRCRDRSDPRRAPHSLPASICWPTRASTAALYFRRQRSGFLTHHPEPEWQSNPAEKNAASCCIVLDHNARNTIQNASETSDWVRREHIHSLRLSNT